VKISPAQPDFSKQFSQKPNLPKVNTAPKQVFEIPCSAESEFYVRDMEFCVHAARFYAPAAEFLARQHPGLAYK
jgi:hypothetical protein